MGRVAFFLRAYNDVDHIAPVIWSFLRHGERPLVVFHTSFRYESDYRFKFLKQTGEFDIFRILDAPYERYEHGQSGRLNPARRLYNLTRNRKSVVGRIYRKFLFDCSKQIAFLKQHDITCCVFEWGTPYIRGEVIEKFFTAAKGLALTTVCLPHGCNVYTHPDVNEAYVRAIRRGNVPLQTDRNLYDYYVIQNPLRRDQMVKWGYDPLKTQAWGSVRFCPEWQRQNLSLCTPFSSKKPSDGRVRVVFMQHQRRYNLNHDRIWNLLETLAAQNWIHLVVKWSTRGGTDYPSQAFNNRHASSANVEFAPADMHSPALVAWADCVVNFGSSIGMEALLQNKPLIAPGYLHRNRTLFEVLGAALLAEDDDQVLEHLRCLQADASYNVPKKGVDAIFREIVYGGREPHDVLKAYYDRITAASLSY